MKKLALLIFLLALCLNIYAQKIITGTISDQKTSEPLAFVNIAVQGVPVGTMSDEFGEFSLSVPVNYVNKSLQFSSVGYLPQSVDINSINEPLTIKLQPTDYKIEEVVINDKSAAGAKVLKNVVANTVDNYVSSAFSLHGNYTFTYSDNGDNQKTIAEINFYDVDGYNANNRETAFASSNYTVKILSRQKPASDFKSGRIAFDEILTADVVRRKFNVLDVERLKDYDINVLGEQNGVKTLNFKCLTPTFYHCGYENPKEYYGTIKVKDNSIISCEYTVVCSDKKVIAAISYSSVDGKYFLSEADVKISYANGNENHNFKSDGAVSLKPVYGKVFYCR